MDRQPLVGVDRGPAKWTPQKKEVRNGSMYSPRRVSVEGPPTPPTPPTPPAPTSDEEHNASDAEAPSSKAFASPYAVPASTTLQRERRALLGQGQSFQEAVLALVRRDEGHNAFWGRA